MNRFTYWRNNVLISDVKPIKKIPKGGTEHLVYYKILNHEFDESPYWQMSLDESQKFEQEKINWLQSNPRASKVAYEDWEMGRRRVYNKKIFKLKEEHQRLELKRLTELEKELNNAFGFDYSPINFETFEGSLEELYFEYKKVIHKILI